MRCWPVTEYTSGFARLRSLYVCYLSLEDPLVHTQVVAYLAGLATRGHTIHLLTFETRRLTHGRRSELRAALARRGIAWHGLRYHKRPSLPATLLDVAAGAVCSTWLIRRHRLEAFHARSHVPAAMFLLAGPLLRQTRFIFDIRGLMAEEYEDAGRWRRGSGPWRLAKLVERRAIAAADGIVVLTHRVREHLFGKTPDDRVRVIPCCADLTQIAEGTKRGPGMRQELGLEQVPVLIYVGKLTGWYLQGAMVDFFVHARAKLPGLHFLVLTQSAPEIIDREFARLDVDASERTILRSAPQDVGAYLAAADAAVSFIRPSFSKISSSPTKIGEYLGAGLPIVCGAGIGDVDATLAHHRTGVLLDGFSVADLDRGAERLAELISDPEHGDRSRRTAQEELSLDGVGVPAYDLLYRRVAAVVDT